MTPSLLFIRHGETDWNRDGRYQGHCNPPLNRLGLEQAQHLAASLSAVRLQAVYSSDLDRAIQTAAPLAAVHALPIQTDPRLRELNFGEWDGQRFTEVWATDQGRCKAWYDNPDAVSPPGGETVSKLWERFGSALQSILARRSGGCVAIVTHGGPLRLLLAWLLHKRLHPPVETSVKNGRWLLLSGSVVQGLAAEHQGSAGVAPHSSKTTGRDS